MKNSLLIIATLSLLFVGVSANAQVYNVSDSWTVGHGDYTSSPLAFRDVVRTRLTPWQKQPRPWLQATQADFTDRSRQCSNQRQKPRGRKLQEQLAKLLTLSWAAIVMRIAFR